MSLLWVRMLAVFAESCEWVRTGATADPEVWEVPDRAAASLCDRLESLQGVQQAILYGMELATLIGLFILAVYLFRRLWAT